MYYQIFAVLSGSGAGLGWIGLAGGSLPWSVGAACLPVFVSGVAGQQKVVCTQPHCAGEEPRYCPITDLPARLPIYLLAHLLLHLGQRGPLLCWTGARELGQIKLLRRREPAGQPNSSTALVEQTPG